MLPRVSAALAQFIAPIATSGKQNLPTKQAFERFVPGKKKSKEEPKEEPKDGSLPGGQQQREPAAQAQGALAQVIPFPSKEAASSSNPSGPGSSPLPAGISQALLQLMNLLHEQRVSILRWIGNGMYLSAARQQKKNGRIRKGTILDHKAE